MSKDKPDFEKFLEWDECPCAVYECLCKDYRKEAKEEIDKLRRIIFDTRYEVRINKRGRNVR